MDMVFVLAEEYAYAISGGKVVRVMKHTVPVTAAAMALAPVTATGVSVIRDIQASSATKWRSELT